MEVEDDTWRRLTVNGFHLGKAPRQDLTVVPAERKRTLLLGEVGRKMERVWGTGDRCEGEYITECV